MIFGSDGIRYICRSPGERFNPKYQFLTVKHGGRGGIGPIHRVIGIMDQYGYKDVFKKVMLTHAKNKIRRGWIVKQDNDPKHTPDSIKTFLNCKKIPILVWPKVMISQIHDLLKS